MQAGVTSTGDRIKGRREALGMSQLALAVRVGLTPSQIYRYESGKNDPSGRIIIALARALNTSTDYLLCIVDDPTPRIEYDEAGGGGRAER